MNDDSKEGQIINSIEEYLKSHGQVMTEEMRQNIKNSRKKIKESEKLYSEKHSVCPQCKNKSYTSTYMGYIMVSGYEDQFKDKNHISCKCGWQGICDDLISEE